MLKNHLIDDVVCEIPVSEYQERLARTLERMKEENFDALIIYSNPWHMSNVFCFPISEHLMEFLRILHC